MLVIWAARHGIVMWCIKIPVAVLCAFIIEEIHIYVRSDSCAVGQVCDGGACAVKVRSRSMAVHYRYGLSPTSGAWLSIGDNRDLDGAPPIRARWSSSCNPLRGANLSYFFSRALDLW